MKDYFRKSRGAGLMLFAALYAVAYIIGFFAGALAEEFILKMLLFDIAATVVIWAESLILRNSSLYDAYWSLTPMVMVIFGIIRYADNLNAYHWIFIAAFMLWSARLTGNWITTFENLEWEDWRYKRFRQLPAPLWHLANFFGIMMVPTIFVFAGMLPLFVFLSLAATPLSLIGSAVVLCGTALELFSDLQMHRFLQRTQERKTCREGLWRYSRHPNYLGEILIWVGVYLALILSNGAYWYLFGGVAVMIFLFLVISIPLAEKRQLDRRPDYADYRRSISALLLLPKRSIQ